MQHLTLLTVVECKLQHNTCLDAQSMHTGPQSVIWRPELQEKDSTAATSGPDMLIPFLCQEPPGFHSVYQWLQMLQGLFQG